MYVIGIEFVAISRVKKIQDILIKSCGWDRFSQINRADNPRTREDKRLETLYKKTKEFYTNHHEQNNMIIDIDNNNEDIDINMDNNNEDIDIDINNNQNNNNAAIDMDINMDNNNEDIDINNIKCNCGGELIYEKNENRRHQIISPFFSIHCNICHSLIRSSEFVYYCSNYVQHPIDYCTECVPYEELCIRRNQRSDKEEMDDDST